MTSASFLGVLPSIYVLDFFDKGGILGTIMAAIIPANVTVK